MPQSAITDRCRRPGPPLESLARQEDKAATLKIVAFRINIAIAMDR
jgi:hypothetical protein